MFSRPRGVHVLDVDDDDDVSASRLIGPAAPVYVLRLSQKADEADRGASAACQ